MSSESPTRKLEPLPYHLELRDYLKSHEPDLWNWFASAQAQEDYAENLRLALLKSTYRLDPAGHPELYQSAEEAKAKLQLDMPVTLYQAQNNPHLNASLYFTRGEGHVVFSGPVLTLLNAQELKSVIGHELAHYCLWTWDSGELQIADRLALDAAADPRAAASHEHTARRIRLYTEIFADRGSLFVTEDADCVVSSLVKMETGLPMVSAAGYFKQAEEIFAKGSIATESMSHPEAFIRARSLALWRDERPDAESQISEMIEGALSLEQLDVVGQARLARHTRRLLQRLLRPRWFRTPAVMAHARMFFDDFESSSDDGPSVPDDLKSADTKLREYLCYVLLDFCSADPDLDVLPLAAALTLSAELELNPQFEKLAAKELKRKIRDVRKVNDRAAELLANAEASGD